MDFWPGLTGGTKSMKKPRRNHSPAFKARIALEALRGEKTVAEISAQHQVHPTQVTSWKTQLLENAAAIFGGEALAANPSWIEMIDKRTPTAYMPGSGQRWISRKVM